MKSKRYPRRREVLESFAATIGGLMLPPSSRGEIARGPRFVVTPGQGLAASDSGRLFVIIAPMSGAEPRRMLGRAGPGAPVAAVARDLAGWNLGEPVALDESAFANPRDALARLRPGTYRVQAVFDRSRDIRLVNAPGNLFSRVETITLGPDREIVIPLELTATVPAETAPPETERVRFVRLRSEHLSAFHGRPIFLRAGVILPRGFDRESDRRYPLRVHIGGFGSRYTEAGRMMAEAGSWRDDWDADDAPRMILLHLDGAGPLGDPYQVNSANHGPYGDAITQELIPHVEGRFRCGGSGTRRVLDGGSTGGWVALALQIFYPDFFNGAWAFCPDPVDFRSFQRVNLDTDANAYVESDGKERPSARDPATGRVRLTMREECATENLLGAGGLYTMSGQQWGSWNAVFSPRGPAGRPRPLWDAETGRIDLAVAAAWKRYDLRSILETNWGMLGPRLRGKLRIWVGEADDYYLNEAVHRLDAFLRTADPPYQGSITFGKGQGHCWQGISERAMMAQMAAATGARP